MVQEVQVLTPLFPQSPEEVVGLVPGPCGGSAVGAVIQVEAIDAILLGEGLQPGKQQVLMGVGQPEEVRSEADEEFQPVIVYDAEISSKLHFFKGGEGGKQAKMVDVLSVLYGSHLRR